MFKKTLKTYGIHSFNQPIMGTKEDLPEISKDEFNSMMTGDPDDIVQTRMPDENPISQVYLRHEIYYIKWA